jgi:hypothetical protein
MDFDLLVIQTAGESCVIAQATYLGVVPAYNFRGRRECSDGRSCLIGAESTLH